MTQKTESYRNKPSKQDFRYRDEQQAFRHFLKEIKLTILIIMWGVIVSGALLFGVFVRLLFFN